MLTLEHLIATHGVDVDAHLDRADIVPVLVGLQRQGDVIVVPVVSRPSAGHAPIPREGVPVVRGENGGNTHLLLGGGTWRPVDSLDVRPLLIGELVVSDDTEAYLAHPEHGYLGIGPGVYQVRRQREQADEIRRVAD